MAITEKDVIDSTAYENNQLLSDMSDYINGTNIYADGGYHIQK